MSPGPASAVDGPRSDVRAPRFDVRAYARDPHALHPADLDLQSLGDLDPGTLEVLAHLWGVERGLLDRLRDLLVTPTHAEARVTAFLTAWAYEQHWLAETLGAVMAAGGRTPPEPTDTPLGRVRRTWDERARPALGAVSSNLLGAETTGAQMVTGGLDTAVLTAVYRRLGAVEPRLAGPAREIVRLKDRHLAFFAEEAGVRLARSASARRLARRGAARWRWPGTRYGDPESHRAWVGRLFADPAARADLLVIDEDLAALPGLAAARPVAAALGRLDRDRGARRGATSPPSGSSARTPPGPVPRRPPSARTRSRRAPG